MIDIPIAIQDLLSPWYGHHLSTLAPLGCRTVRSQRMAWTKNASVIPQVMAPPETRKRGSPMLLLLRNPGSKNGWFKKWFNKWFMKLLP